MEEKAHEPRNTKVEYTLTEAVKLFDDLEDVRILLVELRYLNQVETIEFQQELVLWNIAKAMTGE
ncbi:MAG: hypothetical protein ACYC06_06565 [Ilumatobacteraceae bacterium]